jgi:hypothetical protein
MKNESSVQIQSKMWLDFFPCDAETVTTHVSRTELATAEDAIARITPGRDVRSYVECNCACK